jgi:hypothetical protein
MLTDRMLGMNGFKGLEIQNFSLLKTAAANGTNAMGDVFIPNPSSVTMTVGDASFNLFVDDTAIGNATIPDLTLLPGNNSYPISITQKQAAVAALLLSDPAACGTLPITIKGVASVVDGVEIPYLSKALQSNALHTTLDVAPALRAAGLGAVISKDCKN